MICMSSALLELGLLGHEISYSLSPKLHKRASHILGLRAQYQLYEVASEEGVGEFLQEFFKNPNALGLNVTKPYKNLVAGLTDSPLSSVNTLFRREGDSFWRSASTDGVGFLRAVERLEVSPESWQRLVFLGAGGSVLGILEAMGAQGILPREVFVLRRSDKRGPSLEKLFPEVRFLELGLKSLTEVLQGRGPETFLVQATSAPQKGQYWEELLPALDRFEGGLMDLVYKTPSALVAKARDLGLKSSDGLPMLIEQARCSQQLWWGRAAPYDQLWVDLNL